MKRPSFQFYPADWKSNAKLRRCSEAARGAWVDVLCLLHDCDEYGVIKWPLADIARAAGVPLKLLKELAEKGVLKGGDRGCEAFVFTPRHAGKDGEPVTLLDCQESACWYCSRFVKDEYIRHRRGNASQFSETNQPQKKTPKPSPIESPIPSPKPPMGDGIGDGPSSSSSSSSSIRVSNDTLLSVPDGRGTPAYPEIVETLWSIFPAASRDRSSKKQVLDAWHKTRPKPVREDVLASLTRWAASSDWTKEGGRYVPGAHLWVKARKWESEPAGAETRPTGGLTSNQVGL